MIKKLRVEIILSALIIICLGVGSVLFFMHLFEIGIILLGAGIFGVSYLLVLSREQIDGLMFKFFLRNGCDACGSKKMSKNSYPVACYANGQKFIKFKDIKILCGECFKKFSESE